MPKVPARVFENHLIALLSRRDRSRLLALGEPFELVLGDLLCEPGKLASHVYFPTEGFISLLTIASGSPGLEVDVARQLAGLAENVAQYEFERFAQGQKTRPIAARQQSDQVVFRNANRGFGH